MKFARVSFAIAALVGTAAAQNLAGLPTCAVRCCTTAPRASHELKTLPTDSMEFESLYSKTV